MYAVYIIRSLKDKNLYIGSTKDLKKRLFEHNSRKIFSTKNRTPFELIYCELYKSEKDARHREQNIKLRSNAFSQLKKRIRDSLEL